MTAERDMTSVRRQFPTELGLVVLAPSLALLKVPTVVP